MVNKNKREYFYSRMRWKTSRTERIYGLKLLQHGRIGSLGKYGEGIVLWRRRRRRRRRRRKPSVCLSGKSAFCPMLRSCLLQTTCELNSLKYWRKAKRHQVLKAVCKGFFLCFYLWNPSLQLILAWTKNRLLKMHLGPPSKKKPPSANATGLATEEEKYFWQLES